LPKGYLALVLHAHLPFVRHPDDEGFLEERWLFEALTESYLPLIRTVERLAVEGIPARMTFTLTPPLMAMLEDPLLRRRYQRHLEQQLRLADLELARTQGDPQFHPVAQMYATDLRRVHDDYVRRYRGDVLSALGHLQETGAVEVMASAATHGFLPTVGLQREVVNAQIQVGLQAYRRAFGRPPRGFWLPECGFCPGIDELLADYGIEYVILETHGLLHGSVEPRYGVHAPILTPAGLAAFARDPEASNQVWSKDEGYPGDGCYREFYRDIGFDLPLDYIGPFIHPDGLRVHTGFKYYRITGRTDDKQPYMPEAARERAAEHAGNFMFNRQQRVRYLADGFDRPPLIVAPYDTELFGHWWYEGPQFLEFLSRKLYYDQDDLEPITLSQYLDRHPRNQVAVPSPSSWGYKGYSEVWLEGANDWIYPHLHMAADRMIGLANDERPDGGGVRQRALNQAARELLLAQASDWPFIMKCGTMVDYAGGRLCGHLAAFNRLHDELRAGDIDAAWLAERESRSTIFPDLDYRVFSSAALPERPYIPGRA